MTEPAELMPLVSVPREPPPYVDAYQLAMDRWKVDRANQESNMRRRIELALLLVDQNTDCRRHVSLYDPQSAWASDRPWAMVGCDFCGDECKEYLNVRPHRMPAFDICLRCHAFCIRVCDAHTRAQDVISYVWLNYDPDNGSLCDCYYHVENARPPGKCDRCYVPRFCFALPLLNGVGMCRLRALIDAGTLTRDAASKLTPEEALPFVRSYTVDMPNK